MQWLEPRPAKRLPIRLTPLIDVVFILLLFFMLTSYMNPLGLVQLDTADADGGTAQEEVPARVHLLGDGELRWNDNTVSASDLQDRIAGYGGDRVQLSTDGDVSLADFTQWLTEIRNQGLEPRWQRRPGEDN